MEKESQEFGLRIEKEKPSETQIKTLEEFMKLSFMDIKEMHVSIKGVGEMYTLILQSKTEFIPQKNQSPSTEIYSPHSVDLEAKYLFLTWEVAAGFLLLLLRECLQKDVTLILKQGTD